LLTLGLSVFFGFVFLQGLIKRGNPQLSHDVTFVKLADYGIERNES